MTRSRLIGLLTATAMVMALCLGRGASPARAGLPVPANIEFTQGAQTFQQIGDLANEVASTGSPPISLVAGKPAVMRVYFDSARTEGTTDYSIQTNLSQFGGVDNAQVHLANDCTSQQRRDDVAGCPSINFYFTPPAGNWTLAVGISQTQGQFPDHWTEEFHFTSQAAKDLTVFVVPVCDPALNSTGWECGDASSVLNSIYLLKEISVSTDINVIPSSDRIYLPIGSLQPHWQQYVWEQLDHLWQTHRPDLFQENVAYLGITTGLSGPDITSGFPAAVLNPPLSTLQDFAGNAIFAHAVLRALGISSTNTSAPAGPAHGHGCQGTEADPDTYWPYADNYIHTTGFNVASLHPIEHGDQVFDVMGHCDPVWVSEDTMKQIVRVMGGRVSSSSTSALEQGDFWIVSGEISGGGATMEPLITAKGVQGDTDAGQGANRIEVRGDGGTALFTRNFDTLAVASDPSNGPADDVPIFSEMIPIQSGARRIVVLQGGTEIGAIDLTGQPPTVAFSSQPTGAGLQNVGWTISDADSATFTSELDYSRDGGSTWHPIASGLQADHLAVDFDELGGSANAKLRVQVSDGANTGEATSTSFSVPTKSPRAMITSPTNNAIVHAGDLTILSGQGFDPEDGALHDSALRWSSSLDGDLGGGQELNLTNLSVGTHLITLTAKDSSNQTGTAQVTVTIWDAQIIEGHPNGDVNCDEAVTGLDALLLISNAAGVASVSAAGCTPIGSGTPPFGDVNCDGSITTDDGIAALRFAAAIPPPPPPGCRPVGF